MPSVSEYKMQMTSFSGADIVATIGGKVFGELQGISYSVTREKVPIYTMGSPDPRSFSRGKRGIAGSLVFTVFNHDVFDAFKNTEYGQVWTASANKSQISLDPAGNSTIVDGESGVTLLDVDSWEQAIQQAGGLFARKEYNYADEIFPFDVTITLHNEYGQAAKMSILGVEILNEGSGMSIDDITTAKACTFIARGISKLVPIDPDNPSENVSDVGRIRV